MESTLNTDGESTETFDVKTPEGDGPEQPAEAVDNQEEGNGDDPPTSLCRRIWNRWWVFYSHNDFVIMVVIAILLAKAYPPLGAEYLQPQITSTWIAVIFIFRTYYLRIRKELLWNCIPSYHFLLLTIIILFS
jgi:sodium/bile acid cotransporter 7